MFPEGTISVIAEVTVLEWFAVLFTNDCMHD